MNIYYCGKTKFENVISLNLLYFKYTPFYTYWNEYDYIVVSSKNGVEALNLFLIDWQKIPVLCIGQQTAKKVMENGGKPEYIGINNTAYDFGFNVLEKVQRKRVLIVGSMFPSYDLNKFFLENRVKSKYEVGYEVKISNSKEIINKEEEIYIILTSPKYYNSFKINYGWRDTYVAICIGPTTYNSLPNDINKYISDEMSVESCIEKTKELKEQRK